MPEAAKRQISGGEAAICFWQLRPLQGARATNKTAVTVVAVAQALVRQRAPRLAPEEAEVLAPSRAPGRRTAHPRFRRQLPPRRSVDSPQRSAGRRERSSRKGPPTCRGPNE